MDPVTMGLLMGGTALAGMFSANKQAKAAKQAAQLQADSEANTLAMQQRMYDQTRSDNAPRVNAGNAALSALSSRLMGTPPAPAAAAQPAPSFSQSAYGGMPVGQGSAASAYLSENPDVAAEYARLSPNNLANNYGIRTPEQFAEWHYQTKGQTEGRAWDQGQPATPGTEPAVAAPAPAQPGAAPAYAYDPSVANTGGYEVQARKEAAPLDVSAEAYHQSPGYDYQMQQGLKAVNAGMSASGGLNTGRRMMALQERGQGIADQDYSDWRGYTTGQYNADRSRDDAIYSADRGYTADRYDTNTAGIAGLAGVGAAATAANQNAAQGFASAYGAATTGAANAQAAGKINSANAWGNGLNNIMTTGAYLYGQGAFGGAAAPKTGGMYDAAGSPSGWS